MDVRETLFEPLWARITDAWRTYRSWSTERFHSRIDRTFHPAVLEIQASPPSPTARGFLITICGLVLLAILWSVFGKIDIIAVGQGKIVPTGRVKVIQPLESGILTELRVEDGSRVHRGDILVKLDTTQTEADKARLADEQQLLHADVARLNALLADVPLPTLDGLPAHLQKTQQSLYDETRARNAHELAALTQQLTQRQADLADAGQQIRRLNDSVALLNQRATRIRRLVNEGFYARNRFAVDETERLRMTRELETQQQRRTQAAAALAAAEDQLAQARAEQQKTLLAELADKETRLITVDQELTKAQQRDRQQTLTSPIEGTVQEIAIHTVGGVVTPAQQLMKIVPFEDALEAEVMIPNRDIGFVREGQEVAIKLEAFPFTKYGLIDGTVKTLSLDAIQDEQQGLVYRARIAMDQATIHVGGNDVLLTPGLAITAEIKTGTRRIVEYFLSPLMEYADEAIRER